MKDWYCKSQNDNTICLFPVMQTAEILKFPVYFNDSGVFKCPTCRCEYVVFHGDAGAGDFQPKKVIAKLHFTDVHDRNPVFPITDMSDFECIIPDKYQKERPFTIFNSITNELMVVPSPIQFILQNVMFGLENGDIDFYMRHVPKPLISDELTRKVSDMVITSKWSEE